MGKYKLEETLDLHNYATWRVRFLALCSEHVLERALFHEPCTDEEVAMSNKVKNMMVRNVKNHVLPTITRVPNAMVAWRELEALYAANNTARRVQLRQELNRLRMAEGEALPKYIARARQLQDDLIGVGQMVSDSNLAYALLVGLPRQFEGARTSLMMGDQELNFSAVTAKLLAYEIAKGGVLRIR